MKPLLTIILKIIASLLGSTMMLFFFLIAFILWDKKFLELYSTTMDTIWKFDE